MQYSHGLFERVAKAVALNGFNQAVETIKNTTAAHIAKRQTEQLALNSARDFEEFYKAQKDQQKQAKKTGDILVITL